MATGAIAPASKETQMPLILIGRSVSHGKMPKFLGLKELVQNIDTEYPSQ
jgi:hypothetical protein